MEGAPPLSLDLATKSQDWPKDPRRVSRSRDAVSAPLARVCARCFTSTMETFGSDPQHVHEEQSHDELEDDSLFHGVVREASKHVSDAQYPRCSKQCEGARAVTDSRARRQLCWSENMFVSPAAMSPQAWAMPEGMLAM